MAAHQAPPSLGFSRQGHWSGLPLPSPMRESEVAQSCLTLSYPMDCSLPHTYKLFFLWFLRSILLATLKCIFIYLFYLAAPGLICNTQDLSLWCAGFSGCSPQASLSLRSSGSRTFGLGSYGARTWLPWGMWNLRSLSRDQTHVPCIGRQILNYWTTREIASLSNF